MAVGPEVTAKVGVDTTPLQRGMQQAATTTQSKLSGVGKIAAGVFGGALMVKAAGMAKDFFTSSVQGAMNAEQANVRFATSLRNIVGASDEQIAGVNKWLSSTSKMAAVSKGELRPAFETLLRGTKNVTTAQSAMKTALDVSAGTGKPLAAVALAMQKGFNGSTTGLQRLGIATKDAAGKALPMTKIMENLNKTFGGQAAKQADTTAGRIKNAGLQFQAMKVSIGQALLPVIAQLSQILQATLIPAMTAVANLAKSNPALFKAIAVAVLALVVAMKFWVAVQNEGVIATKLVAAAQWLWNAAVAANPIVLLVVAIVALVAIILILLARFGILQAAASAVWNALQVAFNAIVSAGRWLMAFFVRNWPLLVAILLGPIAIAVLLIMRNWDTLKKAASAVWSWITGIFGKLGGFFAGVGASIAGAFQRMIAIIKSPVAAAQWLYDQITRILSSVVGFITGLPGKVAGAVSSLVHAIAGPINAVIDGLNAFKFTIPRIEVGVGPVKVGAGPWTIDLIPFTIPHLARGGVTRTEGLAWLHPAEVITPLAAANVPQAQPPEPRGPAVQIDKAVFAEQVDIDLFMRRVAWAIRTEVT